MLRSRLRKAKCGTSCIEAYQSLGIASPTNDPLLRGGRVGQREPFVLPG